MRIGGLIKHSMIDYPGKLSCVVFTSGCNFHCPYCHNPDLVSFAASENPGFQEEGIFEFLEKRVDLLEGVVISGGEPALSKDIDSFVEKIKKMGYLVKLDTNGSRPRVIKSLLEHGLVDYVAMDLKTDPFSYSPLLVDQLSPEALFSSIETIMSFAPEYEFRTTCVRPFVDISKMKAMAESIKGARLYCLQGFRDKKLLDTEFFNGYDFSDDEKYLEKLKTIASPFVLKCIIR